MNKSRRLCGLRRLVPSDECTIYVQIVIQNLDDAHELLDRAISTALNKSKPVYVSVSCNLPSLPHPSFKISPIPYSITQGTEVTSRYVLNFVPMNFLSKTVSILAHVFSIG